MKAMNQLKERLQQGKSIVGTMITTFRNPDLAKILKICGFDYFIVDCEHGPFDYSDVAGVFALAREAGIAPMIRIPEVRREVVLKAMEMGAAGILLPGTETAEQAQALVTYSKYAPLGERGVSLLRAHTGYEKIADAREYMDSANAGSILMAQIESVKGVENIEDILDVEGIDAAFIGPNDLTQSMGILGQKEHPKYIAALTKVISAAQERNKFAGIHLMSVAELQPWIEKGMTCNLWSNDISLLMNAAREGLEQLR